MEEVIKIDPRQYIIIRENGDGKEYFCGANIYGRDNDGVLKVSKPNWSKTLIPIGGMYYEGKMRDILNGMRKYGEIEDGYNYVIAEIQTTTAIINYIEW